MNYSEFHTLSSELLSTGFQAHAIGLDQSKIDNSIEPQWKLILGEYNQITFPVLFRQEYGKILTDLLDTGWPSLYLISERMKNVFEDSFLIGWKTFPIEILDKKANKIEGYHGLSITGRCGSIDYSKCEVIEKRLVTNGPLSKYFKGMPIGLDKWDGSDFFLPEQYFGIIISPKAAKIVKESKFSNVSIKSLRDIEKPVSDVLN